MFFAFRVLVCWHRILFSTPPPGFYFSLPYSTSTIFGPTIFGPTIFAFCTSVVHRSSRAPSGDGLGRTGTDSVTAYCLILDLLIVKFLKWTFLMSQMSGNASRKESGNWATMPAAKRATMPAARKWVLPNVENLFPSWKTKKKFSCSSAVLWSVPLLRLGRNTVGRSISCYVARRFSLGQVRKKPKSNIFTENVTTQQVNTF